MTSTTVFVILAPGLTKNSLYSNGDHYGLAESGTHAHQMASAGARGSILLLALIPQIIM